jgi:quercetin dioxygenase-like cupin family protein
MTKRILSLAACIAMITLASPGQAPVPIEKEPMHVLKFENEYVRVFDVRIPAGKTSLYHTHSFDGLGIPLSNTQMLEEVLNGDRTQVDIKFGDASFRARPTPMTHRVTINGKGDFRNILTEILPSARAPIAAGLAPLSSGHTVVFENARIRASRLVLKPGESSKPHTHTLNGLGIALYDSRIEISAPNGAPRLMEPKAGDFVWQTAGTAHTIKNVGTTVFEAIDIEIK